MVPPVVALEAHGKLRRRLLVGLASLRRLAGERGGEVADGRGVVARPAQRRAVAVAPGAGHVTAREHQRVGARRVAQPRVGAVLEQRLRERRQLPVQRAEQRRVAAANAAKVGEAQLGRLHREQRRADLDGVLLRVAHRANDHRPAVVRAARQRLLQLQRRERGAHRRALPLDQVHVAVLDRAQQRLARVAAEQVLGRLLLERGGAVAALT